MRKINARAMVLFILLFTLLGGCAQRQQKFTNIDTTNLSELESVNFQPATSSENSAAISSLKLKALQDTGMSLGAQAGLSWASADMNRKLQHDRKYLDTIFNFNGMMLSHGVLPPVLEEGDNSLNLADPDTIRVADKTYKIVQQARFATTPPNWREYLLQEYPKPTLPDKTLWPRNEEEQRTWREAIRTGWDKGIQQSYSIFQQSLARLKRDYQGMILYRKLLQQKMISQPYVARTELGVTGDGSDMRINDQVLRIVEHPKLQTESSYWNAIVVKKNG